MTPDTLALTQIPYTGFDFGVAGNALYWMGLLAFAVAASYLVLYYKGGAVAFLGSILGRSRLLKRQRMAATPAIFEGNPIATQAHSTLGSMHGNRPFSVSAKAESNGAVGETRTYSSGVAPKDSMTLELSKRGEAPQIVITRT